MLDEHDSPQWYDHGYWCETFWASTKQNHESLCSKWTISYYYGESYSSNMVSESCPKLSRGNRLVNPQISNKGLQKKMSQASLKAVKNDLRLQRSRTSIKRRRTLFEGRNDHGHWCEAFWGSPKQNHENLCSKWTISYHCGESCSSNTIFLQK